MKDIGKYVNGYDMYQRIKNCTELPVDKLMVNEVLEMHVIVDFISKLLLVAGKNVILVVYDRLSKITHFVATIGGISVEGLARLFRDNMWKLHRLPESVISNRRLEFIVELTKELNKMLGIETKLSISFYP